MLLRIKYVDMVDNLTSIATEMFSMLSIDAEIDVTESVSEDSSKVYMVSINAPKEAGLLIGAHGSTLTAIQSFLAMALKQKTGEWVRVVVDIGDWRQKHEAHLTALAKQAADRVRQTGRPEPLYNLTPAQRRVVHVALSKEIGVSTESQGEGVSRYLVVKPL